VSAPRIRYHLNVRAALILTVVGMVLAMGLYVGGEYQQDRVLGSAMDQVRKFKDDADKEKDPRQRAQGAGLALRHVNQYLASRPNDPDALEIQAQILYDQNDIRSALQAYEHFLRVAPAGRRAQKARLRLAELNIRVSLAYSNDRLSELMPEKKVENLRYHAAELLTDQWLDPKSRPRVEAAGKADKAEAERLRKEERADEAEAHRLRAFALQSQIIEGKTFRHVKDGQGNVVPVRDKDGKVVKDRNGRVVVEEIDLLDYAIREYQAALELTPKDVQAASLLAVLLADKKKDKDAARKVLDDLLAARPEDVDARLARYVFFKHDQDDAAAAAELKAAAEQAPENLGVIVTAAMDALRGNQRDTALARQWLEKIPKEARNQLFSLEGWIDYLERNRVGAVNAWSKGLERSGGTDANLTWQLATVQLELGHDAEAAELVEQYRRLVPEDSPKLKWLEALQDERAGRFSRAVERLESLREKKSFEDIKEQVYLVLGRCQEAQGDREDAANSYQEALKIAPGSVATRLTLAQLLMADTRRPEEGVKGAIDVIEQGMATNPDDPALLVALVGARLHQQLRQKKARPAQRNNWADFDAAFKRAAAAAPGSPQLAQWHAERLAAADQMDQAARVLDEAVTKAPKSAELALELAKSLTRQGHPDQALRILDQAMSPQAAGDRGNLRSERARIMAGLGRGREALAGLVRDVGKIPDAERAEVWNTLILLCQIYEDRDSTRDAYTEWARQLPRDPRPRLAMMELDIAAHKDEKTILEHIRAFDPGKDKDGPRDRNELILSLAQARERLWRRTLDKTEAKAKAALLKEADALVEGALKNDAFHPLALMLKGQILEQEGNLGKAIDTYTRAWERGSPDALLRLVDILTRPGLARPSRKEELDQLRHADPTLQLNQIVAKAFIRNHDPAEAIRIVEESVGERHEARPWHAEIYKLLGSSDKAESVLRILAEQQPERLEAWLALLQYQAGHNRGQAVAATVAEIKKRIKTDRPELLEAQCLVAVADQAGADKAFDEALRRYPDDRRVLLTAAQYFETKGRNDRAEACRRHAVGLDSSDRTAARQLAITLSARPKDWAAALALLGPEGPPNDTPEDRLARGVVLARSADAAQRQQGIDRLDALAADLPPGNDLAIAARDFLVKVLLVVGNADRASRIASISARTGGDPAAVALYAEALLMNKQFDVAETEINRLAKIDPGNAYEAHLRVRLIQGRSHLKRDQTGQSAATLEQAYLDREDSGDGEAFGREVFALLIAMGPDAREVAERVGLRLARKNPALSWMPATVLAGRGARDDALNLCRTAAQAATNPGDLREAGRIALEVAVASRVESSALDRAHAVLDTALGHTPDADDLLVMKAMIEHLQGHYDREVRLYRAILTRQPRNSVVLNNLAWALSEGLNQPAEGLEKIDDLIRLVGRQVEYLDTRGVILMHMGRFDPAIKDLEEVVRSEPTGAHLFHLAQVYHKAGRDSDCRTSMAQARKAGLTAAAIDPAERADFDALMKL
jgi:tetratricopeptide (TPR) repeat protein